MTLSKEKRRRAIDASLYEHRMKASGDALIGIWMLGGPVSFVLFLSQGWSLVVWLIIGIVLSVLVSLAD